jgi:hypothetical protein
MRQYSLIPKKGEKVKRCIEHSEIIWILHLLLLQANVIAGYWREDGTVMNYSEKENN